MKRFFIFATITFLISSCASNETADSKNVSQSQIYQNYTISWVQGSGSASVSFRFGGENGTTLRLTQPSKVTFNDQVLTESKFIFGGVFYDGRQTNYSSNHVFKFTDMNGKTYENGIDFDDIEFLNPPKTISKKENTEFEVSRPIPAKQQIVFNVQFDTTKSSEAIITNNPNDKVYYDQDSKKLIVKPEFFAGISDDEVELWFSKTDFQKPLKQKNDLDGELHFTFQSNVIDVKRVNELVKF